MSTYLQVSSTSAVASQIKQSNIDNTARSVPDPFTVCLKQKGRRDEIFIVHDARILKFKYLELWSTQLFVSGEFVFWVHPVEYGSMITPPTHLGRLNKFPVVERKRPHSKSDGKHLNSKFRKQERNRDGKGPDPYCPTDSSERRDGMGPPKSFVFSRQRDLRFFL